MREPTVPVDKQLLYEAIGFLEGVEQADGEPLRDQAGMWAGFLARRLWSQHEIARDLAHASSASRATEGS